MNYLSIKKTGNIVGILFVAFFVVCMAWGLLLVDPTLKELHKNLLLIAYPGFGFSIVGILVGIVESYIYGWFSGALFSWLCKKSCGSGKK